MQVAELLSRKPPDDVRVVAPKPPNVTNISITQNPHKEVQVFQKGPQITTLTPNRPETREAPVVLPIRSKSSLSNVSNTHIPAPEHHCKNHRAKQRPRNGFQMFCDRKNHRDTDYSSETNDNVYGKKSDNDVMDQSYKKATKIVHELTRNRENALYEKHRQKCITASEKYNADILKHYNARKSTSVLDFRSEIHIGPKYCESKSAENLDELKNKDSRSVKSLDFDSDCNSTKTKSVDYTSEPTSDHRKLSCYYDGSARPRPTPPKKPLRLSLHKTQSLQSVENGERKSLKRGYKEVPVRSERNGDVVQRQRVSWNYRRSAEGSLENGSWC